MTASVVTFSNQIGSGGSVISRGVAEKLHYRYYDWEIIAQAAQEAGVSPEVLAVATSERSPGIIERVISRLASAGTGEEVTGQDQGIRGLLGSEDFRQFIERVVRELGRQGDAVIVNRAGHVLLGDVPGVLSVLVHGSVERRTGRFAAFQQGDPATLRKTLQDSDRQRAEYLRRVYRIDWLSCQHYDLAINTDHISQELAIDMIVATAREMP